MPAFRMRRRKSGHRPQGRRSLSRAPPFHRHPAGLHRSGRVLWVAPSGATSALANKTGIQSLKFHHPSAPPFWSAVACYRFRRRCPEGREFRAFCAPVRPGFPAGTHSKCWASAPEAMFPLLCPRPLVAQSLLAVRFLSLSPKTRLVPPASCRQTRDCLHVSFDSPLRPATVSSRPSAPPFWSAVACYRFRRRCPTEYPGGILVVVLQQYT